MAKMHYADTAYGYCCHMIRLKRVFCSDLKPWKTATSWPCFDTRPYRETNLQFHLHRWALPAQRNANPSNNTSRVRIQAYFSRTAHTRRIRSKWVPFSGVWKGKDFIVHFYRFKYAKGLPLQWRIRFSCLPSRLGPRGGASPEGTL